MRDDPKNPFGDRAVRKLVGLGPPGVSLDVLVTPDQYLIEVDLPGVALEDIELTFEGNELTIRAMRTRSEHPSPRKDYAFLERKFGEMTRTLALPGSYGGIASKSLANGVLTLAVTRKGTHEQLS